MENLRELLLKMQTMPSFEVSLEMLKRKADKGLLGDLTSEQITAELLSLEKQTTDIPESDAKEDIKSKLEVSDLIKESANAVKYYYENVSNIASTINKINKIDSCHFLNESYGFSFDAESLLEVRDIIVSENLNNDDLENLVEYYQEYSEDSIRNLLLESAIENDVINFLDEYKYDSDITEDVLLEGEAAKAAWESVKSGVKTIGRNMASNVKNPIGAISGMSSAISQGFKTVASGAMANPLGALAVGGVYAGAALLRKLIRKAMEKRAQKKQALSGQNVYDEAYIEASKKETIEDLLR